jgi:hypothetical protein
MDDPISYKFAFLNMLIQWAAQGKRVVGYGAPQKAIVLLSYCGIDRSLIEYLVDSTDLKVGTFTPGTCIPIYAPEHLDTDTPDVILIMAHNWASEIVPKIQAHRERGAEIYSRLERI